MADLAATDVTVTVLDRRIHGVKRECEVKIEFGDGAKTVPTTGVPMPAADKFGMIRNLAYLQLYDQGGGGYQWRYDRDNNTLRPQRQNLRTGSTAAGDSTSGALVEDSAAAETAVRAMGSAVDTDYDVGPLKEAAGLAIAAQTLYGLAVGW